MDNRYRPDGSWFVFFLDRQKYASVSLPSILRWYMRSFEKKGEDVMFPRLRLDGADTSIFLNGYEIWLIIYICDICEYI